MCMCVFVCSGFPRIQSAITESFIKVTAPVKPNTLPWRIVMATAKKRKKNGGPWGSDEYGYLSRKRGKCVRKQ